MLTGMEMMTCRNLAVPVEVMRHIVDVESGDNPYAIGVVGARLVRQPQNLGEALATVHMLDAKGYNFSLGVAQVNRANLGKYGLDSYEQAFKLCPNLWAGARILAGCHASSGGDWGKSFSCYYSGNFVTGYRDGYVQKVYDSINRSAVNTSSGKAAAIPLQRIDAQAVLHGGNKMLASTTSDSAAYRVSIRSALLDTAATVATVPMVTAALASANATAAAPSTQPGMGPASSATVSEPPIPSVEGAAVADVFVPEVHGLGESPQTTVPVTGNNPAQMSTTQAPLVPTIDQADLRQGGHDDAFVF